MFPFNYFLVLFELWLKWRVKRIQTVTSCSPLEQSGELRGPMVHVSLGNSIRCASISTICESIDGVAFESDILSRIYGGVVAYHETDDCIVNPK